MTKTAFWRVLCALVVGSSATAADKNAHVVIISIDGFAGYLLDDPRAPVPMVRSLAKAGGFVVRRDEGLEPERDLAESHEHRHRRATGEARRIGERRARARRRERTGLGRSAARPERLVRMPTLFDAAHAAGSRDGGSQLALHARLEGARCELSGCARPVAVYDARRFAKNSSTPACSPTKRTRRSRPRIVRRAATYSGPRPPAG